MVRTDSRHPVATRSARNPRGPRFTETGREVEDTMVASKNNEKRTRFRTTQRTYLFDVHRSTRMWHADDAHESIQRRATRSAQRHTRILPEKTRRKRDRSRVNKMGAPNVCAVRVDKNDAALRV